MAKQRILIVEDDSIVATDIQHSLESFGYGLGDFAISGEEALRKIALKKYDLAIMDILLKGKMDGIETARHLHDHHDIPVIFLTAYSGGMTIERAKTAEPYGYIVKPFDDQVLHTTIEIALHKHRIERELRAHERLYSSLLAHVPDAVLATDLHQTVVFANAAAEKLTGLKKKEIVGRPIQETLHWASKTRDPAGRDPYTAILAGGPLQRSTRALAVRDHREILVEEVATVLQDAGGAPTGMLVLLRDFSSPQPSPATATAAAHPVAAGGAATGDTVLRSLSFFGVSGDIRAPLSAIIGFSDLLHSGPLEPEQKEYTQIIAASSRETLDLIDDVLVMAQIESGKIQYEHIDFDLERLIQSVLEQIETRAPQDTLALFYEIPHDLQTSFNGPPGRLRQILTILMSYLVFHGPGREIGVTVQLARPHHPRGGHKAEPAGAALLKFCVKAPAAILTQESLDVIQKCFTPDSEPVRKPARNARALRFQIVRHFVQDMGGTVSVAAQADAPGVEFSFTLGLNQAAPVVQKDISPLRLQQLRHKKVGVIDADPRSRHLLECLCRSFHMEIVFSVAGGADALRFLADRRHKFDLLLCEPLDVEGYNLATHIAQDENLQGLKIVAVTSGNDPGAASQARRSGFDAYLPKPIVKADFARLLQTTLGDFRPEGQIVTRHMSEELLLKGVRVLLAEGDIVRQKIIDVLLHKFGCEVDIVPDGADILEHLRGDTYHICLVDVESKHLGGEEAIQAVRHQLKKQIPIIALTSTAPEQTPGGGITDFLLKPVDARKLREKISKWVFPMPH